MDRLMDTYTGIVKEELF